MTETTFDPTIHNALFFEGDNPFGGSGNLFRERWTDMVVASLVYAGVFSNTTISDTAPSDTSMFWLDTTTQPAIFKRFDNVAPGWVQITYDDIFQAGPQGPAGQTILSGNGPPLNSTGNNGDLFFDTQNTDFYGPKSNGVWGAPTSLVGPVGPPLDATVEEYIAELAAAAAAAEAAADAAADSAAAAEAAADSLSFVDRADAAAWIAAGNTLENGGEFSADGLRYRFVAGATAIPDMLGVLPSGIIYVEHFGLQDDLAFSSDANGYTRTAGTNSLAIFQAADAYATATGQGFFFCRSSAYIQGQFNLVARLHWETDFRDFVWLDVSELESGFVITDANGGVSGVNIIIQHNTTTKEANRGHHGNAVTVGQFMATSAQPRVHSIHIDVGICRAADVAGQDSYPSPSVNLIGYTEHSTCKLRSFGVTNSPGSILYQSHWGGHNASGDATLEPVVTYHPNNIDVEIVGVATGHRRGVVLSSVFGMRVKPFSTDGIKYPFLFLQGDNVNDYAIPSHAPHVGLDNQIGFIRAINCEIDTGDDDDAVLITTRGTSKFENFAGTSVKLIKQIAAGLMCEGFDIQLTGNNASTTGIRVFGALGSIDLGAVYCSGETKASVEIEYGNADVKVDVRRADRDILYEYATGGSILGSAVDKSDSYDGTGDYCVQVVGNTVSTVTTAAAVLGDTTVPITAFNTDVHVGDRLLLGDQPVIATAFIDNTVPFLVFTPLQGNVDSGATVKLDRRARLKRLVASYAGSEYGANIVRADILDADFSDVKWTGRNAARLSGGSIVRLTGDFPVGTSRLETTSDFTFRVGVDCSLHLLPGVRIPANADLGAHVQLQRAGESGPWGVMIAHGAIIEDVSNLYDSSDGFRQARLLDCHDYDGDYIDHPDGNGSDVNGEWRKNADGTMEVWARNVNIGATQPYTWTFPGGGFIATATTSVHVTPASATTPRMGHGVANSATTAQVWAHNDDGTDAPSTGVNLHAKGYWR